MKFPFLAALGPQQGWYKIGPLGRVQNCNSIPTPLAEARTHDEAKKSMELTLRWAQRCRDWVDQNRPQTGGGAQLHFPIVQGSTFQDLRERCARELVAMDFPGYAVGGLSVGEPEADIMRIAEWTCPILPANKPRYAMGLGTPPQLVELIARGIHMFDCVLPTRLARNGTAFTHEGMMNLRNAQFAKDFRPIAEDTHPLCQGLSRAYIRHLINTQEVLGLRLISTSIRKSASSKASCPAR